MTTPRRKTVDPKCYAFAQAWLYGAGWTHTGDIEKLAEKIQEACEEFEAELEEATHE